MSEREFTSYLHRSLHRESGLSWWGERPLWLRHAVYWLLSGGFFALLVLDDTPEVASEGADAAPLIWFGVAFLATAVPALGFTLWEWQTAGVLRTISRSLVLFVMLLAVAGALVSASHQLGVDVAQCRSTRNGEVCSGQASPRQIVGMLSWNALDVLPVLKMTESFDWERPARSESIVVRATVVIVRLWTAIGVLGVVKLLWDSWGLTKDRVLASPPTSAST